MVYGRIQRGANRLGASTASLLDNKGRVPRVRYLNVVGPQIRKLRYLKGWSQSRLAIQLQLLGLDKDRVGVAKIESRLVHVNDFQMLYLSEALGVPVPELFPKVQGAKTAKEMVPFQMHQGSFKF